MFRSVFTLKLRDQQPDASSPVVEMPDSSEEVSTLVYRERPRHVLISTAVADEYTNVLRFVERIGPLHEDE